MWVASGKREVESLHLSRESSARKVRRMELQCQCAGILWKKYSLNLSAGGASAAGVVD